MFFNFASVFVSETTRARQRNMYSSNCSFIFNCFITRDKSSHFGVSSHVYCTDVPFVCTCLCVRKLKLRLNIFIPLKPDENDQYKLFSFSNCKLSCVVSISKRFSAEKADAQKLKLHTTADFPLSLFARDVFEPRLFRRLVLSFS